MLSPKYRTYYIKNKARRQDYIIAEIFSLVNLGECIDQPDLKKKKKHFRMEEEVWR